MKRLPKGLRITIKTLIILIIGVILIFGGFLIYSTIDDYQPLPSEEIDTGKGAQKLPVFATEFSLMTWNIGYCGLGKEMDFFYEGGRHTRPEADYYQAYLNGVYNLLARYDTLDFIFLQEVDQNARRSYHTDQTALMGESLDGHTAAFVYNYKVDFVPLPPLNPMADVKSGMMSLSRFVPAECKRIAFPVNYSWPMKLFMLDRCFIFQKFNLANGKDLVLINTHNSAFNDADDLRYYELMILRSIMLSEYEQGNYVIAGGDWNLSPPDYDSLQFRKEYAKKETASKIDKDFFPPSWNWAYDHQAPTNRDVSTAYTPGETPTTVLDYFIVSPNVRIKEARVIPTNFEFSDHQPVYLKLSIMENPMDFCPDACAETIRFLLDSLISLNEKSGYRPPVSSPDVVFPDVFYQRK